MSVPMSCLKSRPACRGLSGQRELVVQTRRTQSRQGLKSDGMIRIYICSTLIPQMCTSGWLLLSLKLSSKRLDLAAHLACNCLETH